jgi:phosphoribosylamine--glycine ligase
MKVLIVGSGGREHALAWRMRQSHLLTDLWVANGNAGTASIATNLNIDPEDLDSLIATIQNLSLDMVVVGPETPLALGIVDRLKDLGVAVFGPTRAASQLEISKSFALDIMEKASVPCPKSWVFSEQREALAFLDEHPEPVVVKVDGLASGKGVFMCRSPEEAAAAVRTCMTDRLFGSAGDIIVIQELLYGTEVSVFAFSDGEHLSSPIAACDYKRLEDGGEGINTGGMGAFAVPDFWSDALADEIIRGIMLPVITMMAQRGTPYQGILYAGLMLTQEGPKALEFNCRLGDPESQVILPLLITDPIEIMTACLGGYLAQVPVQWQKGACVGVVMASGGYPTKYETGFEVTGLETEDEDTVVFHAGTRLTGDGSLRRVVTSGGRVLTIVAKGDSLAEARQRAYHRVREIRFRGAYYRNDIALLGESEVIRSPKLVQPNI